MSEESQLFTNTGSELFEKNDRSGNDTICDSEIDIDGNCEDFDSNWKLLSVINNEADPVFKRLDQIS